MKYKLNLVHIKLVMVTSIFLVDSQQKVSIDTRGIYFLYYSQKMMSCSRKNIFFNVNYTKRYYYLSLFKKK